MTAEELAAALPHVLAAPKTDAPIFSLCWRAGFNRRSFPDRLLLTRRCGIPGERWLKQPWLRLPDGRPDPRIQVSILPARVSDLVWRDRQGTPHPGDTIVADLDTSEPVFRPFNCGGWSTELRQFWGLFGGRCDAGMRGINKLASPGA
ncbi:hypothetical protein ORIO_18760 [Cereibacter azotoformans]|nr:hypothetical protein [Cereibacter azotoformans]ULB11871.1 hypothetical protein ORIO_18760 [Cereibacter azotoformans]